jgi:hypothetical protein
MCESGWKMQVETLLGGVVMEGPAVEISATGTVIPPGERENPGGDLAMVCVECCARNRSRQAFGNTKKNPVHVAQGKHFLML